MSISPALIRELREHFVLDWHGIHGAAHWARVRANGLRLSETTGANVRVVEAFAFLHDSCRLDDAGDPQHGRRAARYAATLNDEFLGLADEELAQLQEACRGHSDGMLRADATVMTCWDADRLDLGRVGIRPDPRRLCTEAARASSVIEWAYKRRLAAA